MEFDIVELWNMTAVEFDVKVSSTRSNCVVGVEFVAGESD